MMDAERFLNDVLKRYEASFDIERPYEYHNRRFDAYAHLSASSEKYVLVKSATLWRTENFEHVFFEKTEDLDEGKLDDIVLLMREHMEPELVREGRKYPGEDHMMTFLSYVVICEKKMSPEIISKIRRINFGRSYLLTFRGRCEAHIIVADLEEGKIYTNRYGRYMSAMYEDVMKKQQALIS
ncbi:MAG: hypothetical protein K6C99_01350 [Lachnospiraceae bacterium]|nr:hypothetical protein [Lachnospiraceae bacterium]